MTSTCMVLLQLQAGLLVDRIRKPAANVRYTFQADEDFISLIRMAARLAVWSE